MKPDSSNRLLFLFLQNGVKFHSGARRQDSIMNNLTQAVYFSPFNKPLDEKIYECLKEMFLV